ncbi:MAG TPA: OsmC family protein [Vicinamibacterales bacterium]|nr:OsmC family protein [Vicinamibacterales bacterium]
MPVETTLKTRRERLPLNGVDTPTLFATLDAVKGQPELAKFQFRARNRWQNGTLSESTISTFSGAGGEHAHKTAFKVAADHPAVLVAEDRAPLPVEYLLHALASCITGGIANIAAARGITLREVESTIEGDIDLLGIFGMSKEVRNGYQGIRASFSIKGDATPEQLQDIVEQSRARSAVYDVLTNGVPVSLSVNAG